MKITIILFFTRSHDVCGGGRPSFFVPSESDVDIFILGIYFNTSKYLARRFVGSPASSFSQDAL